VQGESGLLLSNGSEDAPAKVGVPITDQIAGVHAALGIVAALHRRERTGEGGYLDVSMLESAVYWLAYYPHHYWHAGTGPPRSGMRHQYLAPYGPFLAADHRYVNVVVASDADWRRFCDAVGQPDWANDERLASVAARSRRRAEVDRIVEQTIASAPAAHWMERLADVGLPYGQVRSIGEVLEHPQLKARQLFGEAESPVGMLPLVRFPLGKLEPGEVPALGQHTDSVLAELGYDEAQIAQLRASGAV